MNRTSASAAAIVAVTTAAAMAIASAGVPSIATAGATAGARIAALVPQVEVTGLLIAGVAAGARAFRTDRFGALRRALTVTPRGPRWAVWTVVRRHLAWFGPAMATNLVVWLVAVALPGGPTLRATSASRLLLVAFGAFAIALGTWVSVLLGGRPSAVALAYGVVVTMAAAPLAIAPVVSLVGARAGLVAATMLSSPWILAAGASGLDLVRMEWVYALSPLGSIEAPYSNVVLGFAAYGSAAALMLALAARGLGAPRHPLDRTS